MKHSTWGDLVPHTPKSSVVKTRGIRRLQPAHKRNKITIINNQVAGLAGLSRVEYEDVVELMSSLGVGIPDRPGESDWKRELANERRNEKKFNSGWNSSEGWGIGDQIEGWDGSEQRRKELRKIVDEAGGPGSLIRKKPAKKPVKAEWTAEHGWKPLEEKRGEFDDEEDDWDPTELEGEMEMDPTAYQAKYPVRTSTDRVLEENHALDDNEKNSRRRTTITPSFSSNPPTLPESAARTFVAEDLDKLPNVSFSSPAKIDLAGMGPGWLEETEFGGFVDEAAARSAAADRMKTFKRLGIKVPVLVSPRFFSFVLHGSLFSLLRRVCLLIPS